MSFQSIRRAVIASGLVIGAAAAFSPAAFAGTNDTVPLSGTVTSTVSMTVTNKIATSLDLKGDGTPSASYVSKVADVNISTNNSSGATVTATFGNLVNPDGTTPIPVEVSAVDDGASAPSATGNAVNNTNYTFGSNAAGSVDKDLYIKFTPAALQDPNTYESTLTLNVADNS